MRKKEVKIGQENIVTKLMAATPTEPAETGAGGTTQPAGAADDVLLPGQPGRGGAGGTGAAVLY